MDFSFMPVPSGFIGREEELQQLTAHLLGESGPDGERLAFVHGPSGVGKTALLQEFAGRHLAEFDGGIQYLPSFDAEFEAIEDVEEAASVMAEHLDPRGRGLFVIEEVTEADPIKAGVFVRILLRKRPGARIVLTSQLPLVLPKRWLNLQLQGLPDPELEALLDEHHLREDDLRRLLSRVAGNPLLASTIAGLARQGQGVEELLARLDPATYSGLLGPDGRPLDPTAPPPESMGIRLQAIAGDLVDRIERDPNQVYGLSPREFEELVAAIYEKHGFEVELTPSSNDGGVDLYAVRYEPFGKVLTVVECKRNSPRRPVGVEIVRSLHGAVEDKGANVGVLATTSSFTAGARAFQQRHDFRLALQDWFSLQDMLKTA
jgi:restriction system protein